MNDIFDESSDHLREADFSLHDLNSLLAYLAASAERRAAERLAYSRESEAALHSVQVSLAALEKTPKSPELLIDVISALAAAVEKALSSPRGCE